MRTTVTITDTLLDHAKRHATERGLTLGTLFEDALRAYLASVDRAEAGPFRVHTVRGRLVNPSLDLDRTSALEIMDDEREFSSRRG